jgi:hypothetical protein
LVPSRFEVAHKEKEVVKIFYDKSEDPPVIGLPMEGILTLKPVSGDIGIEIEVEALNSLVKDASALSPWWSYHPDGSLRGYDNAEYVIRNPIKFDEVPAALDHLWGKFAYHNCKLADSNRTSVHVHLNCQKFHLNRLTSFCALWFAFEEVLTEWCGDHRVGNLFCLRAKDAPAIISGLRRFIRSDAQSELRDGMHYSGFNASALFKFGSIEIRTLRGVKDKVIIEQWIAILRRLYDLSAEYKDPRDVCAAFSQGGPLAFFDNMLGDMAPIIRDGIPFNDDRIRDSMYEGIRLAQDLCYCRDWDVYKPVDLKDDPFKRPAKIVAKKLINTGHSVYAPPPPGLDGYATVPTTSSSGMITHTWMTNQEYQDLLNSQLAQAADVVGDVGLDVEPDVDFYDEED